jgi:hypothetical protein
MTDDKLAYANKLKHNIEKAKEAIKAPISLDLVIKRAKESASVIGYLSKETVEQLKTDVRVSIEIEIEKMQKEFDNL